MTEINADVEAIIKQAMLSFVATVNEDGTPNLSPTLAHHLNHDLHRAVLIVRSRNVVAVIDRLFALILLNTLLSQCRLETGIA